MKKIILLLFVSTLLISCDNVISAGLWTETKTDDVVHDEIRKAKKIK